MYKGMNFGGGNMQQLMKQAQKMQEQMQNQMAKAEEELENTIVTGSTSGMVSVSMTGKRKITEIKINPNVVDPDDVEMLEDMIVAGVNDALAKVDELEKKLKGGMAGGLF